MCTTGTGREDISRKSEVGKGAACQIHSRVLQRQRHDGQVYRRGYENFASRAIIVGIGMEMAEL